MTIPGFQTIMLPFLEFLADGELRNNQEVLDALARRFQLSEDELAEMLPSGTQRLFHNRVAWAKSHMKMAELLEAPKRAHVRISDRGLELLATRPEAVSMKALTAYPEYVEFRNRKSTRRGSEDDPTTESEGSSDQTPEEQLDQAS